MAEINNTVGDPPPTPPEPSKAGAQPSRCQHVPLDKIIVPPGRRPPDPERVAALAESIAAVGQLQPIGLTTDFRLIYGATRMAACELVGHDTIQAITLDLDDLHAELATIDENLQRRILTVLEEAQALARRKEIYLVLNPKSTPVTKKGGPGRGKKTSDIVSPVSFAAHVAKKRRKHGGDV